MENNFPLTLSAASVAPPKKYVTQQKQTTKLQQSHSESMSGERQNKPARKNIHQ